MLQHGWCGQDDVGKSGGIGQERVMDDGEQVITGQPPQNQVLIPDLLT